jgi:hypothetical protein
MTEATTVSREAFHAHLREQARLHNTGTYNVEFGRVANIQRVPTYKVKTTAEMVYADNLASTFRHATGLATSL